MGQQCSQLELVSKSCCNQYEIVSGIRSEAHAQVIITDNTAMLDQPEESSRETSDRNAGSTVLEHVKGLRLPDGSVYDG